MKINQLTPKPLLSQTENNTTLWIGHLPSEENGRIAGQTFFCPDSGILSNIQVYSATVAQTGTLTLSLHEFDPLKKNWGPALCTVELDIESNDTARWIRFETEPLQLQKNSSYGFRLQAKSGLVGLGEAASHSRRPFSFGKEWQGAGSLEQGKYFSYFSLAFKIELCA